MACLVDALPRLRANDPALTTLNVDATKMTDQGAQQLASALKSNDTLKQLSAGDEIDGVRVPATLKMPQTCARCARQARWASGAADCHACPPGANQICAAGAADLAAAVAREQGALTELSLSGNKIGNRGATALASAVRRSITLEKLHLANCEIGDEGASMLAEALLRNPRLVQLDMRYNHIGPKGASQLAAVLASDKSLTMLGMYGNRIGNEGVGELAAALRRNTKLIATCLGENGIGDEGAQKLAEALSCNVALTAVDLRANKIGEAGRLKIAQALRMRPPPLPQLTDLYPGLQLITGMQLRRAATHLAMPPSATGWRDSAILQYMWQQQSRSLAFWMLTHQPLGKGSLWADLDLNLLGLVLTQPIHYAGSLNDFESEVAGDDEEDGQQEDGQQEEDVRNEN